MLRYMEGVSEAVQSPAAAPELDSGGLPRPDVQYTASKGPKSGDAALSGTRGLKCPWKADEDAALRR